MGRRTRFHGQVPGLYKKKGKIHINALELITIITAIKLLSNKIMFRIFLVYCNNTVSVEVMPS